MADRKRGMTAVVGPATSGSGRDGDLAHRVTGEHEHGRSRASVARIPDATSRFYANAEAAALYHAHVRTIVT
jgi:hypothetical protein